MSLRDVFGQENVEPMEAMIGVVLAAPPEIARPFLAVLQPGNESGVEVLATTRDALDLPVDVQEYRPQILLLSPEVRNYTPQTVAQIVNWPDFPVAVVGLVPSAGMWGSEMANNGAIAFYNTPITPAVVEQFSREARTIVERARAAWRAPAVASGVGNRLLEASGATAYQTGVLAFWSTKGGDGKTTLSTEVACILSQVGGKRVLLVDANMSGGHVALHLSISPERNNIMHLASEYRIGGGRLTGEMLKRRAVPADSYLDPRTKVVESRLNVLLGITQIQQASSPELAGEQGERFITDVLRLGRQMYDFVVADLGSTVNAGAHIGTPMAADVIMFIASADRSSIYYNRNVLQTLLREVGARPDKFRLVVNNFQPEGGIQLDEIARYMGMPVFACVPHDPTASVLRSINEGRSFALSHLDIRRNSMEVEATLRGMFAIAEGAFPPLSAIVAARDEKLNGKGKSWLRIFSRRSPAGAT